MELKDVLEGAYKEVIDRNTEAAKAQQAAMEAAIRSWLQDNGVTGAEVEGDIVASEGVTLKAIFGRDKSVQSWQVKGNCPKCGEAVWSQETYSGRDLALIYYHLINFIPHDDHYCNNGDDSPETWQDKLGMAIAEAIKAINQGCND